MGEVRPDCNSYTAGQVKGEGRMRALWRKYFYIPPHEYMSDRVFIARLMLNVFLIMLYLFCMVYTACALFQSGTGVAV